MTESRERLAIGTEPLDAGIRITQKYPKVLSTVSKTGAASETGAMLLGPAKAVCLLQGADTKDEGHEQQGWRCQSCI